MADRLSWREALAWIGLCSAMLLSGAYFFVLPLVLVVREW